MHWEGRASLRRRLLAIGGALLTAAIVLPAQARADCGVTAPEVGWQLAVHLSHSYCLTVTPADVSPKGGGEVLVVQSTKGTPATGLTRVEYPTRSAGWSDQWKSVGLARADNWVSVDLGTRGNLAVHFYPRRTAPLPPRGGCAGQVGRQLLGVWKGTITFTGEHRYATVHTRATPGTVVLNPGRASDPNCGQVVTVGPTDIPGPFSLRPSRWRRHTPGAPTYSTHTWPRECRPSSSRPTPRGAHTKAAARSNGWPQPAT